MPKVSILIPAYRDTWIDDAIQSALAQNFTDFEVLIGDDCPTEAVSKAVERYDDKRIQYFRNPDRGIFGSNRDNLIKRSNGEFIKFLFDDDYLYPNSVELLLDMAKRTKCKLVFHNRIIVDANKQLIWAPPFKLMPSREAPFRRVIHKFSQRLKRLGRLVFPSGEHSEYSVLKPHFFFNSMIADRNNIIGEPTNTLIHAATLKSMSRPFAVKDRRMRFLTDVALYTNFMIEGKGIAGTSVVASAYRHHGNQTSSTTYAGFSAGLFEWELLMRWAVSRGKLSHKSYKSGIVKVVDSYRNNLDKYPELNNFIDLAKNTPDDDILSASFLSALARADGVIDRRASDLRQSRYI